METTKNLSSHSISQNQLHTLSQDILDNIEAIFGYFGINNLRCDHKKYVGACPVHGGGKDDAFNLYHQGPSYIWKCWTHQCEDTFIRSPVGLVRGLLSHKKYNWSGPGDDVVSLQETVSWLLSFLGKDLDQFKINEDDVEKLTFVRQVDNLTKIRKSECLKILRNQIRKTLDIPSKYYIDRGYSKNILDKYDVGFCSSPNKEMYGRAVVPIYDEDYHHMIGCTGRVIHPFCSFCSNYHKHGTICNTTTNFKEPKWKHNKGFRAEQYLYNYWFAKKHILESGTIILTEGPGDVWRLEEAGIHNTVAIFGTSLCPEQKAIIDKSGALTIIILTDNGGPGREATKIITKLCEKQYKIIVPEFIGEDIGSLNINEVKDLCQKF